MDFLIFAAAGLAGGFQNHLQAGDSLGDFLRLFRILLAILQQSVLQMSQCQIAILQLAAFFQLVDLLP